MADVKINTPEGTFKITQKPGDLINGIKKGDLSRISAYGEGDATGQGLHTGTNSQTVGRHNQPFGRKK
ncbi:MAG: hypothetical protein GY835_20410 [bacterium]|nr:hypothetical protein [bacterium]